MSTIDGLHDVTVEIGGYFPSFTFRCRADATTDPPCHMACNECEEGCYDDSHVPVNQGECCVVTWLENSDADECILKGAGNHLTAPIRYEWHAEGVDWAFAGGAS